MGACTSKDLESDQPAPTIENADPVRLFELDLPFCRTHITTYVNRLNAAESFSGEEPSGLIHIDSFKEHFVTEAWSDLQDPASLLRKVLDSKVFGGGSSSWFKGFNGNMSKTTLICFGLIHCQGSAYDKTQAMS